VNALFIELPAFARHRSDYLGDEERAALKDMLKLELISRRKP